MATYIVLENFTDQGIRSVKETAKRAEAFKEMARKAGVKVKEVYWTLGQYDVATIVEAPDEETATALGLSACSLGNIRARRRFGRSPPKKWAGSLPKCHKETSRVMTGLNFLANSSTSRGMSAIISTQEFVSRNAEEGANMTWVIGPLCIDKMDTACVEVCPVDCIHIYTGNDPAIPKNRLLIDPAECIDCAACEAACPSATGGKAIGFATDVTKRAEVEALIQGAVDAFGRVDVLLNNASIMPIAPIGALKVDEWDRQIDVNIKGLLYGVAAALPHMQKQKSDHMINIASVFGIKVFAPGATVYCATKSAGRALTEGLRMELHSQNIRCTMISPGAVATELPESSSEEATRKNLREFYKMAIPANSIARAIAYAIEQPADVEIDEVVVRPTAQDF